jgi:hypothetical protein
MVVQVAEDEAEHQAQMVITELQTRVEAAVAHQTTQVAMVVLV